MHLGLLTIFEPKTGLGLWITNFLPRAQKKSRSSGIFLFSVDESMQLLLTLRFIAVPKYLQQIKTLGAVDSTVPNGSAVQRHHPR